MSVGKWDNLSRLDTLLVFLNVTAKTKLEILGFLYCEEIVKTLLMLHVRNRSKSNAN